jgi:hypothetical protein
MNRRALLQALAALPLVGSWLGGVKASGDAIGVVDYTQDFTNENLICHCVEWWYESGSPVATCSDGRIKVYDGEGWMIFPAPAADIWRNICVRKLNSAIKPHVYNMMEI